MTDEEFLKLAREHCAQEWSMDGYAPTVELEEENFLSLCREIERRVLEKAAKRELAGKDLVCFCAPKGCHGDVLLEVANAE